MRRGYEEICFWVLTAQSQTVHGRRESGEFKLETYVESGIFHAAMKGRVDTLSAPILLSAFEEAAEAGTLTAVSADAFALEYISSAGLRVLLIMAKKLGPGSVTVTGANDTVRDIFSTTGFDELITLHEARGGKNENSL